MTRVDTYLVPFLLVSEFQASLNVLLGLRNVSLKPIYSN